MGVGTKLVQEYIGLMAQGHGENCPWRNKGCDGLFYYLKEPLNIKLTDCTQLQFIDYR